MINVGTIKDLMIVLMVLLLSSACFAQERPGSYVRYGERYMVQSVYSGGTYLGDLNSNRYAPNSISNPYGVYGSRYSPSSINSTYGNFGRYSSQLIYVVPARRTSAVTESPPRDLDIKKHTAGDFGSPRCSLTREV